MKDQRSIVQARTCQGIQQAADVPIDGCHSFVVRIGRWSRHRIAKREIDPPKELAGLLYQRLKVKGRLGGHITADSVAIEELEQWLSGLRDNLTGGILRTLARQNGKARLIVLRNLTIAPVETECASGERIEMRHPAQGIGP